MERRSKELVFVPCPGVGHIISTIEFATRLLDQHPELELSVTLLIMPAPFNPYLDSHVTSLVSSLPRFTLFSLPPASPPLPHLPRSIEYFIVSLVQSYLPHVRSLLQQLLSGPATPLALFLDLFCTPLMDAAHDLSLPSYIYLTSGAGFLDFVLHLPVRHPQLKREFFISDPDLPLPGSSLPLPMSSLPGAVFDGDQTGGYAAYLKFSSRFRDARGIVVNTFFELEHQTISSLSRIDGIPPLYTVGPVIDHKGLPHPSFDRDRWEAIWRWLDQLPDSSVVFLCFGSMGGFNVEQVKEIAAGLEHSGHRFLWALRMLDSPKQLEEVKPESILPEGFLGRTEGRGVVCGWAPQVEVLGHRAIGGFVSHCGWNSTLESLWHGVPMLTWPIYAEQQLNAFRMVKELGLAVELRLDYREGAGEVVKADEIERGVRLLMEGEAGEVRRKVKEMKEAARRAVCEGGSSYHSIHKLIQDLVNQGS
ncbi:hypothetical protein MLD38_003945 [Melastoma candidum]|uniref:Uncharacterized protein n=1 Tax=Melastoma candidum TaxID=119954 RepID=A0ACB9S413_9MYRT|nr:hypothetical protein MLD38_003945 [Melastoma candidum]